MVKNPVANAGDTGLVSGLGRYSGEGNGNPVQCSCLENPRDGGACSAAVCGVAQRWTRLKRLSSSSSGICSLLCHILISKPQFPCLGCCKNIHAYHSACVC